MIILAILFLVLWLLERRKRKSIEKQKAEIDNTVARLSKYQVCEDADAEAARIRQDAQLFSETIKREAEDSAAAVRREADDLKENAQKYLQSSRETADQVVLVASNQAKEIIADAQAQAKQIAGDAYETKQHAEEYKKTAEAMRNIIEGYGTQYLKPSFSLLDELAEDFSFSDAGQKLKEAREKTARMVRLGLAAKCDYVEANRRDTAIAFVTDAFNGKVDSILSKTKKDNFGTLEQRIRDAYQVVNNNGRAFRNAVITPEYLDARLDELKWGCIVSELKAKDQEEQRRIREQMREEEKARREFERAQKEAAKEEAMLRKAMEKAQAAMEKASEEQKAKYESQLAEIRQKLEEAEAKSQKAISLAQQTKRGNVYVISNIGSFGENVYKVGMTRRWNPLDRVKELGDASVPFPFDVHAIIESEDAPALETSLHKALALMQVNKVNPRKEFFRVSISDIHRLVTAI